MRVPTLDPAAALQQPGHDRVRSRDGGQHLRRIGDRGPEHGRAGRDARPRPARTWRGRWSGRRPCGPGATRRWPRPSHSPWSRAGSSRPPPAARRSGRSRPSDRPRSRRLTSGPCRRHRPARRARRASGPLPPSTARGTVTYSSGHHGRIPSRMYAPSARSSADEKVSRSRVPSRAASSRARPTPRSCRAGSTNRSVRKRTSGCPTSIEAPTPAMAPSTSATSMRAPGRATRCSRYG